MLHIMDPSFMEGTMQETALYREQWHYNRCTLLNSQYLYCVRRPINTSTMALVSHSCVKSSAWCGVVFWCGVDQSGTLE